MEFFKKRLFYGQNLQFGMVSVMNESDYIP